MGIIKWYPFRFIIQGWHQLCNHFINGTSCKDDQKLSKITVNEGGWVEDHKGKCLLWLPIEWEMGMGIEDGISGADVGWFPDIPTIWFEPAGHYSIIVKHGR